VFGDFKISSLMMLSKTFGVSFLGLPLFFFSLLTLSKTSLISVFGDFKMSSLMMLSKTFGVSFLDFPFFFFSLLTLSKTSFFFFFFFSCAVKTPLIVSKRSNGSISSLFLLLTCFFLFLIIFSFSKQIFSMKEKSFILLSKSDFFSVSLSSSSPIIKVTNF